MALQAPLTRSLLVEEPAEEGKSGVKPDPLVDVGVAVGEVMTAVDDGTVATDVVEAGTDSTLEDVVLLELARGGQLGKLVGRAHGHVNWRLSTWSVGVGTAKLV